MEKAKKLLYKKVNRQDTNLSIYHPSSQNIKLQNCKNLPLKRLIAHRLSKQLHQNKQFNQIQKKVNTEM